MKRFIIKILLFTLPLLLLVTVYVITDPFKVIYHYGSYYESGKPSYVAINRDFVSCETFNNNYKQYHYDSYILGNSRSLAYKVSDWSRHINSKKCFHFDASAEGLYGVEKKLEFLQKQGAPIKNVLIVLDDNLLSKTSNQQGMLYIKHPMLTGQNQLSFQLEFLKNYFDSHFIKAYIDFKLCHKVKDYMKANNMIDDRPITYNLVNNELRADFYEKIISNNKDVFYKPRMEDFYERDSIEHVSQTVIEELQLKLLLQIKSIFEANHTNYRIVISPSYDQLKFNPIDLKQMQNIFGIENIFDFSGKNAITQNIYNYYEVYHYRPNVATLIMDSIYKPQQVINPVKTYYTKLFNQ